MTSDSNPFLTHSQILDQGGVPEGADWLMPDGTRLVHLYEAKFINFFGHHTGTYETRGDERGNRVLPPTKVSEYQNPDYFITPYYWVPIQEVDSRLNYRDWARSWLLGWGDITSATNERTVIAGVMPRYGCGDSFLLMFPKVQNIRLVTCLCADQCSLVHDYVARQKIGGLHIKYHTKKTDSHTSTNHLLQARLRLHSPPSD